MNPIDYWYKKYLEEKEKNKQIMKDAVECIVKVNTNGYPYIDVTELYNNEKPLAKKGDKVKLIISHETKR